MAITYQAGRRIQATSTDFGTDGAGIPAVVGGWKELGRTTLGSGNVNISVSSLANKRYLMVLKSFSGSTGGNDRLNGDSGSNYASRRNYNGGTDSAFTSVTAYPWANAGYSTTPNFIVENIANKSDKEKLILRNWIYQGSSGAGTAPQRLEVVAKWANTSDVINAVSMYSQTSNWDSGSEIVVLGWDPTDTHTTNFWEELASVNASGSSTNLSSGTITAKKYLWIQCYTEGNSGDILTTFNNDSGSNYARRLSVDGAGDSTSVSQPSIANVHNAGLGEESFSNWFIINNTSNEKLCFGQSIQQNTAGAGNAPKRTEFAGKWANTSAQITEIDFDSQSGNFGTNSIIKVWGSN